MDPKDEMDHYVRIKNLTNQIYTNIAEAVDQTPRKQ